MQLASLIVVRPIEIWNVTSITDMSSLFALSECNPAIGDWDVSNIVNFVSSETHFSVQNVKRTVFYSHILTLM